jgi:hypothetical protein
MNEIDLVRNFRVDTATPDEEQVQRARIVFVEVIKQGAGSRTFGVRERVRRVPRSTLAVILAVIALPGGYAIADSAGVFEGGTVDLTLENAIPAPAPGSEPESTDPAPPASELPGDLAPGADVISDQAREDARAAYDAIIGPCREREEAGLELGPCERILNGDFLGAPKRTVPED